MMNPIFKKVFVKINTRTGKAAAISIAFATILYITLANAPIVKVGANSTRYTYTDIEEVHSFNAQVASISPKKNKIAADRKAVFQSLMLAGICKEILDARKIPQGDKERLTMDIINASPYGGLLEKEREELGEDRFYKLFIQPVVVDRIFGEYYVAKESGRNKAEEALKLAQTEGLSAAAAKVNSKVERKTILIVEQSAALAEEARKSVGSVLPKYIEEPTGYAIMQVVDITENQIVCDVFAIQRQAIGEFIEQELADTKVPVTDYFYSWFRVSSLKKSGGFLAKVEAKTEKKGE